ncbi:Hypothetical predicted protein [Pelobates cultripes]|uniref:Uncharacterized protein n=1 Tax=Pelobates cultripes TaxID=61616 RepID=A0AAD1W057_PELCU|nr:Hypothetical predicted protein [Pelobates cultripes]
MATSTKVATATTKMATATSKTATATSKMATTNIETSISSTAAAYNPNMPPEMASGLPASADMLIDLIKNLRIEIRNDLKKILMLYMDFWEDINSRTEDVENRLYYQEQSHLELEENVNSLQK